MIRRCGGALLAQPAAAQDITLEFVVWNYSLDTIQDNAKKFEAENPGIKVKITDYTWPDYHDSMVLRFRGGTPTDVAYVGQDWLPAWAAAGFLAPLDDIAPADVLADLKSDMAGFSLSDMTYNGKLYGLPYYADTISFIYNKKILEDAGIAVPHDLGRGDGRGREAEGRRHGASDRLRVRPGAAELLRRLRGAGLRPRRRSLRRGPEGDLRRSRTTPPTSSSNGWPTPSRRTSCSRRRTNRRSSRR